MDVVTIVIGALGILVFLFEMWAFFSYRTENKETNKNDKKRKH